jgi:phosphatidylinositol glycan class W
MDGGVGSFIISHALTSAAARDASGTAGGSKAAAASSDTRSLLSRVLHILRGIFPLLVLGVLRLFTIKATQYQEHVSEYGVHWNFFFTLAAVAILSACVSQRVRPRLEAAAYGLGLLVTYQFALTYGGLGEYILNAPRLTLFSANKEGIFSSIGYFSLYLVAVSMGHTLMATEVSVAAWKRKVATLAVSRERRTKSGG